MSDLSQVTSEVERETSVKGGVKKLLQGLASRLEQANPEQVKQLGAELKQKATELSNAMAKGTDAESEQA